MESKILFTWLGMTDLQCSQEGIKKETGPIGEAVAKFNFTEIHILSDYEESANFAYCNWLKTLTSAKIAIHTCKLSNPMNFGDIYNSTVSVLDSVLKDSNLSKNISKTSKHPNITFHISPGTSAMAAIWIIVAKTSYPAKLIQSSKEEGAKIISVPFDISAEFTPALSLGVDDELLLISQGTPPKSPKFDEIIHKSSVMKNAINKSRIIALHNLPVLIYGESGTGKELFAKAIHASSPRKSEPFIEVNCGAIPDSLFEAEFFGHEKGAFTGANFTKKGYIESANGGTLFLDEIGEMPIQAQVKLLRAIQEKKITRVGSTKTIEVDFRIICATHKNLLEEVKNGNFREDLFHRVAIGVITLPPLRERKGDLGLLIDHFIEEINCEFSKTHKELWSKRSLSINARNRLLNHPWYGNVRELRNTLLRVMLWSKRKTISSSDVKKEIFSTSTELKVDISILKKENMDLKSYLAKLGIEFINQALDQTEGKKSKAAEILGFKNYQTMDNWIKKSNF